MNKPKYKTGHRFNMLTLVSRSPTNKAKVVCVCDCGKTKEYYLGHLTNGTTKSCGCYRKQASAKRQKTHGLTNTPEFRVWITMVRRCHDSNATGFKYYGGRGIKVCKRWIGSFELFLSDMGTRPSNKHSMDRADCNGDYCPENCKWSTVEEQANNKRNNWKISYNNESLTVKQYAKITGFSIAKVYSMCNNGKVDATKGETFTESRLEG